MTTRKKILLAVADGCCNTRQVAKKLGLALGTVNAYFYDPDRAFVNGDLLQWEPSKVNTLRPGPNLAIIRDRSGRVVDVGRFEI